METCTIETKVTDEERKRFDSYVGKRADELARTNPLEYWWQVELTSRVHVKSPFTPDCEKGNYMGAMRYALEKQGFNTSQG